MKKLIMGIGIPGSGKTTILQKFAEKNGYVYICPDDIRKELTGDISDQSKNKEIWAEAYKRTKEQLIAGKTIVFDATFTHQGQRKEFLTFVRESGAEKIQGIYLDIDLGVAKERNESRQRKVPEHVLERMSKGLSDFPPEITDGLDSLFIFDGEYILKEVKVARESVSMGTEHTKLH